VAGERGDLAIPGAGRAEPGRAAAAPDAIDDASRVDGDGRRERAAQLDEDQGDRLEGAAAAAALLDDGERHRAELVGGPEVDAVDLAVGRDGVEVDDAGDEDDGEVGGDQRAGEGGEPADAARLAWRGEECESKISVGDLGRRYEGESVA